MIQYFISFSIIINISGVYFGGFLRLIEISSGNLPACYHQFAAGTVRKHMSKLICHVKSDIIECLSYRNIIIIFINLKYCCKDCILRRPISIEQFKMLRRFTWNKLFTTDRKSLQTPAVHLLCKLSSNLGCHKCIRNAIFFKIIIESDKVKPDLFRNDMKLGSIHDRTINIHHRRIKSK